MKELFEKVTSSKFNKIVCVGKNYLDHVAEMSILEGKTNKKPKYPIIFTKPISSLVRYPDSIKIPNFSKLKESIPVDVREKNILFNIENQEINYEFEFGFEIRKDCKYFSKNNDNFYDYVKNYFVGLDLTNRTLQSIGKDDNTGWFYGKEFDYCTPISDLIFKEIDVKDVYLEFKVNGIVKQSVNTSHMIFDCMDILEFLSNQMKLQEGDLIFTGTPSGIGKISIGDLLEGTASYKESQILSLKFKVEELV